MFLFTIVILNVFPQLVFGYPTIYYRLVFDSLIDWTKKIS
jgi:hypothetical protein